MKKASKAPRTTRAQPKAHKAHARPAADSGNEERDGRRLRRRRTEARLVEALINYLVVRGRDIKLFAGLELDGEATWTRLEAVMAQAFRGVLGSAPLA